MSSLTDALPQDKSPINSESKSPVGDTPPATQPVANTFVEGGLQGWLTVLGAALTLFSTFGAALAFGIFQDYYTREYLSRNSPSEISWIGSTQLFLDFFIGLPTGRLYDAGHFRLLMISGSVIYLFSFFMLSLTHPQHYYQVFLSQGIGMGIGMGLVIVPAVSVPSHYFRRRRTLAMGIVFAGSSVGGLIFPIMINNLILRIGFPWAIRATAFMILGLLLVANAIMVPKYPNTNKKNMNMSTIFKDVPYVISVFGSALIFWGLFFPYFYLQLFSVLHGVNEKAAFYSLTAMNAATVLGRTLPNAIADKYGAFNVAIPMTTLTGALMFAMFGVRTTAGMFIFALVYGFFSGAYISLLSAIFAGFSQSLNEIGTRIGIGMSIISFALLTGNPITGALLNPPHFSWSSSIIFSGVVVLGGVALLVISRAMAVKTRKTWRV